MTCSPMHMNTIEKSCMFLQDITVEYDNCSDSSETSCNLGPRGEKMDMV